MLKLIGSIGTVQMVEANEELQASIVEQLSPEFVYFRARAVTADVPNGNGDLFPRAELERVYQTFRGKHVDFEHKTDPAHIIGKIIDAYPVVDAETNEYYIEILGKVDKVSHPDLARLVHTRVLDKVSMEANVERSQCSHCGHVVTSNDDPKCVHAKLIGQMIDGKKVHFINTGATFTGVGVVLNPADKKADIKAIFASLGITENSLATKMLMLIANEAFAGINDAEMRKVLPILSKLSASEFLALRRAITKSATVETKVAFVPRSTDAESYFLIRSGSETLKATLSQIWGAKLPEISTAAFAKQNKLPEGWYRDASVWGREITDRIRAGQMTLASLASKHSLTATTHKAIELRASQAIKAEAVTKNPRIQL